MRDQEARGRLVHALDQSEGREIGRQAPFAISQERRRATWAKLSTTQFRWLAWFADHGGMGRLKGARICCGENPDNQTNTSASLQFLALVATGAVEGHDGGLRITEYGLRLLKP